jgi:hypothetical protein
VHGKTGNKKKKKKKRQRRERVRVRGVDLNIKDRRII